MRPHWTPHYLWSAAWERFYRFCHPAHPWLTPQAIRILDGRLDGSRRGFEWGAGKSTLWLAPRVAALTSVEHDSAWHHRVEEGLRRTGRDHVRLLLKTADAETYVGAIENQAASSLEFVLVDGLHRGECARAALDRLAPGGILVVDNAERFLVSRLDLPEAIHVPQAGVWTEVGRRLQGWPVAWTSNGVWATAIWEKPFSRTA